MSARHARIILPVRPCLAGRQAAGGSGIQMFKDLDSRYKLAGMTIHRELERDPVFPLPRWEDQGVGDRLF